MDSKNFYLLADQWPELYKHATLAEKYVQVDPATATVKLRCFAESLVGFLYRNLGLSSNPDDGLFEKLLWCDLWCCAVHLWQSRVLGLSRSLGSTKLVQYADAKPC